jgi:hypothetical protein
MKRLLSIALVLAFSCCLHAQVTDAGVCDILKSPQSFNGKIVRIKGTVAVSFDQFVIKGVGCDQHVNAIWLSYPEGTKGKAGPFAMLQLQPARNFSGTVTAVNRATVTLDKNKDFKQFDSALAAPYKGGGMCMGCVKFEVTATLVGRIDGTEPALRRDATGKIVAIRGFGNLNAYSARLVLQSVSEVAPQEIDYSKAGGPPSTPDPDAATKVAQEFKSRIAMPDQPKRAAEAFGKEGDDNGVGVGGMANEASDKTEAKSEHDSPDGVQYNCSFDFDRLKGDAMTRAMAHIGEHIADLRNPEAGNEAAGIYQLEYRAWMTTMLNAIMAGQKSLMTPGGYVIWNSTWAQASLNANTHDALTRFLGTQALLSK